LIKGRSTTPGAGIMKKHLWFILATVPFLVFSHFANFMMNPVRLLDSALFAF
jgi:hypothetical protein